MIDISGFLESKTFVGFKTPTRNEETGLWETVVLHQDSRETILAEMALAAKEWHAAQDAETKAYWTNKWCKLAKSLRGATVGSTLSHDVPLISPEHFLSQTE